MARGKQTRKLTKSQIERLKRFKIAPHDGAGAGYSLPQLRNAMSAPFGWETLKKALQGLPIWDLHHSYVVQWLDRFVPEAPAAPMRDGKALAAGERADEAE